MTKTIAARRIESNQKLKSLCSASRSGLIRNNKGMTRSLQTIVDKAIVSTITIPVAADKPPINANSANACC